MCRPMSHSVSLGERWVSEVGGILFPSKALLWEVPSCAQDYSRDGGGGMNRAPGGTPRSLCLPGCYISKQRAHPLTIAIKLMLLQQELQQLLPKYRKQVQVRFCSPSAFPSLLLSRGQHNFLCPLQPLLQVLKYLAIPVTNSLSER